MSITGNEHSKTELLSALKEQLSTGLGLLALKDTAPEATEDVAIAQLKQHLPEGGMAYQSMGEIAELYAESDAPAAQIDPIVEDIAMNVATDFKRWEEEINSNNARPPRVIDINRNDAGSAISLWELHPSEETEAAARHILHYANNAVPAVRRQAWSEAYMTAFNLMVQSRRDHEANPAIDVLTLTNALRQNKIARQSVELVEQYDRFYRPNDN